jgi:hypothetical protein
LREKIQQLSDETSKGLQSLPQEISGDPSATVLNLVMDFHRDVNAHVEGIPEDDGLIQQLRAAQDRFRKTIKASTPEFRPYKRQDEDGKTPMPVISFLDAEDSEMSAAESTSEWSLYEEDVSKLSKM